jgi:proteasome lid subunit RPN8/RPN11
LAYYDDLDPHSLDTGIVVFDGVGYGPLWQQCRDEGLTVVADVHTHPGRPGQSDSDRKNPMIAKRGHIALIVPKFAERTFMPSEIGVYEYEGEHRWRDLSGSRVGQTFYVGYWG